jgi:hypothetical protein
MIPTLLLNLRGIEIEIITFGSHHTPMNVSSYVADFTFHVSPSTLPRFLWDYYVQYLWAYKPSSWVARIAYTSRLLAILLILPVLVLTLLVCHHAL